jgi:hypothetical protein
MRQVPALLKVNSEHATDLKEHKSFGGFFCRRQCLVPTWRGWLALLVAVAAGTVVVVRTLQPFLAVNAPVSGGLLVVEGWMPDFALKEAIAEFGRNHYSGFYVTGGPLSYGAPLSEYRTFAEMGAATIMKLGLSTNVVQPVPAPRVRHDRTFASALALKHWLREHGIASAKLNVISKGAHARRTRLLYEKAFGKGSEIGIVAVPDQAYDAKRWWESSDGFRDVINELVAYVHARLLFRTAAEEP